MRTLKQFINLISDHFYRNPVKGNIINRPNGQNLYPGVPKDYTGEVRKRLVLTLNAPITTKAVCFSRLLKCLRSLYGKQQGAHPSGKSQGNLFFLQGQGKVREFCKMVREIRKSSKVREKSGNFKIMLG